MNHAGFIIGVLFLLLSSECEAVVLTLDECVDRALRASKGLKSVEFGVTATEERIAASKSAYLPSLKLNASFTLFDQPGRLIIDRDTFGPSIPPQRAEVETFDRDLYLVSIGIEQVLFSGGRTVHTVRKAEAGNEEAVETLGRERERVIFLVRRTYHEVLSHRLKREVAERTVEAKKERLRVLRERQIEGFGRLEDVLRQETDLAYAELEVVRGRHREELSISRMKQLVDLKGGVELVLSDEPRAVSLVASLEEVTNHAIANRKDLKIAQAQIRGAEEDIALSRSGFYPQAALQGKYLRASESNFNRSDTWLVSATLDWTVFEWGKTSAEVREKNALKQKLLFARAEQEESAVHHVERAWREAREKELTVRAHEKRVKTFEQLAKIMADRYAEGEVKLVDVLEMETQLVQEFNQYMVALHELGNAAAAVDLEASGAPANWWTEFDVHRPRLEFRSPGLSMASTAAPPSVGQLRQVASLGQHEGSKAEAAPADNSASPAASADDPLMSEIEALLSHGKRSAPD